MIIIGTGLQGYIWVWIVVVRDEKRFRVIEDRAMFSKFQFRPIGMLDVSDMMSGGVGQP